ANMRLNSVVHLFQPTARQPWMQAFFMALHLAVYVAIILALPSWPMAIAFVLIHQAAFGVYNSSVFASNHKGMPLTAEGDDLDFLREQVLTSRNVAGHPLTDFWYGGLNYQIEHHLFPTMPRNQLAKA